MKNVCGLWLPDGEEHFDEERLGSSPRIGGLPTYQFKKYRKALSFCEDKRLAIDIGSHVGLWTNVLARQFKQVVCFEPLTLHRECWERNVGKLKNVTLHPYALGAMAGTVSMHMPTDNTGHSHVAVAGENEVERCELKRLDDFDFKVVDFIKIDVEGFELPVVQGAEHTIRLFRPTIIIEQKADNAEAQGWGRYDALEQLKAWGMSVHLKDHGDYVLGW